MFPKCTLKPTKQTNEQKKPNHNCSKQSRTSKHTFGYCLPPSDKKIILVWGSLTFLLRLSSNNNVDGTPDFFRRQDVSSCGRAQELIDKLGSRDSPGKS